MARDRGAMKERLMNRMQKSGVGQGFSLPMKQGTPLWVPDNGSHIIDIMPYYAGPNDPKVEEGEETYLLELFVHSNVGVNGGMRICLQQTYGKPCPICEDRARRQREGDDEKIIKALTPSRYPRTLYDVIVGDSTASIKEGHKIFHTSFWLLGLQLEEMAKRVRRPGDSTLDAYIPYMDLQEGKSIVFKKQGEKDQTKYVGVRFEDRDYSYDDEEIDRALSVDSHIIVPTYDDLELWYFGEAGDSAGSFRTGQQRRGSEETGSRRSKRGGDEEDSGSRRRRGGDEEDSGSRRRRGGDEEEEKSSRRRGGDDEEKEEKSSRRRGGDEEDSGSRRSRRGGDDEEKEEKEEKAGRRRRGGDDEEKESRGRSRKSSKEECPAGGDFGKDIDEFKECKRCDLWEDCARENEAMKSESKKEEESGSRRRRGGEEEKEEKEEKSSRRRRGGDDEEEDSGSRRSRRGGSEDDEEKEEKSSRRSRRGGDDEEEDSGSRRRRASGEDIGPEGSGRRRRG